jgi:hypothetical protein
MTCVLVSCAAWAIGRKARPVVNARPLLDQAPAQPVAHRADAVALQQAVVGSSADIVLSGGKHVQPHSIAAPMCGTLEPAHEETLEQGGRRPGLQGEIGLEA